MVNPASIQFSVARHDAAGPVLDLLPFYKVFSEQPLPDNTNNSHDDDQGSYSIPTKPSVLSDLDSYPREHWIALAHVAGTHQSFRKELSHTMTDLSPSWWLELSIRRIGNEVYEDDRLLLEEEYDSNECQSLTNQELVEACLLRGLPVIVSYDEMRHCLTNHLSMIRQLNASLMKRNNETGSLKSLHDANGEEGYKLFVLHLSALRWHLKEKGLTPKEY
eukprot:CAMPEP_0195287470 /NCGR_PEP_ID=MMETSP0707-20130614/4513_1 /TAXON_ID=33640 /ORGANISM="Asterionellopsis glacialis, Strain CCMP134" /LENGTH=218 /DNA_ID=CAMNT_0040347227 /DNA_START=330 /DNA_END=986 /DNA_ORIENTATION=+